MIVRQGCTVKELMSAFEKEIERRCSRQNRTSYISWSVCVPHTVEMIKIRRLINALMAALKCTTLNRIVICPTCRRYVWRSYWLAFGQARLEDKHKKLSMYAYILSLVTLSTLLCIKCSICLLLDLCWLQLWRREQE